MALQVNLSNKNEQGLSIPKCYMRITKRPESMDWGAGWIRFGMEFYADKAAADAGKGGLAGIQIEEGIVVVNFKLTDTMNDILTAAYDKIKADPVTWPEFVGAANV